MVLRSELSRDQVHAVPLDSIVADSQGAIGYMLQRELREELSIRGLNTPIVTIVTEIEVDPLDQAFKEPSKPIGQFYTRGEALELEMERNWVMMNDSKRGWRRAVPSPAPLRIIQLDIIKTIIDTGAIVICCGGGGVPVAFDEKGRVRGIEGVIDKDRSSALLAVKLDADKLVITTGVDAIYVDFLTDNPRRLDKVTVDELMKLEAQGQFPKGSMRPKVLASHRFVSHSGNEAVICLPEDLVEAVNGDAGTHITQEIPK